MWSDGSNASKDVSLSDYLASESYPLDQHECSEVAEFYNGRSVFITGASGFIGKCLLEKLLRSCPGIRAIYILLRPKKGIGVLERLKILKESELFDKIRGSSEGSRQLDKIIPIEGDITKPAFGLTENDIKKLSDEITLIFHSAATVRFAEPLSVAVSNNVVDEVFYEAPIDADKLIDMANWMDPELLDKICPTLLGKRPNTYTYTKAVAESLLVKRSEKLIPHVPIAMVRPSIVAGVWQQPICGWVDNFNGPTGVILSMMTGAIQGMLACPSFCADIVPVDVVANLIICTARQVHEQHNKSGKRLQENPIKQNMNISVFNCVSGTLNPLRWENVAQRLKHVVKIYPCDRMIRSPGFLLLSNEFLFNIYNFLNHTTFAYTGDFLLKTIGKKPTLVMIYKRMMKMIQILKPFTTNQWLFECSNVTRLYNHLSAVDREIFNFDVRQIVWNDYLDHYYVGAKIYAMRDNPAALSKARHKLQRMSSLNRIAQIMLLLIAYYFLVCGTSLEGFIIQSFSHLFSLDLMMFKEQARIASRDSNDLNSAVFKNEIG